ncbi:MAG: IS3 family transposase [Acidobacteria bacterium]|nr:IS3 family transposase [Acidobacteriota bacterium]
MPGTRATQNERLVEKIKAAHGASRSTYGSPKIYRQLRQQGEQVNHKRIARLMKERGIRAKWAKKFAWTTDSRHSLPVAENIPGRDFRVARLDAVWTSDITYLWMDEGWLYLAVFLDLCSRLVVVWAVSESLEVEFVERAFLQGQARRARAVSPLVQFRPGQPIRERRVPRTTRHVGLPSKHELQGELLGQRGDGKFLR